MQTSTRNKLCVATAALAVGCSVSYIFYKMRKGRRDAADLFNYLTIKSVNNEVCCDQVVIELRRRCQKHRALGFDCEWVTDEGTRHPVALVQLSSFDGYCGLFRLSAMKAVPASLKDILEDETIYKVGVSPSEDGKYLRLDYGVALKSTLDVRHLAKLNDIEAGGLATLSSALLGAVLDKSWRIRCSDWEAEELSQRQTTYAAIDAHVAIRIFALLLQKFGRKETVLSWLFGTQGPSVWARLDDHCSKFADVRFKQKHVKLKDGAKEKKVKNGRVKEPKPKGTWYNKERSKPLYNNGQLLAPDGELLCTCNKKKAMWFVNKGLADLLKEEPITIRLNFEPAGRAVDDVGRFYTLPKENRCVVCGDTNSYIRKNVVPREYRKRFPEIMKDHSSHDVVLLCQTCHQQSNINDYTVREGLAKLCDAPLPEKRSKKTENPAQKKIRLNARALLYFSDKMPEERRKELEDLILQHFPDQDEITEELLKQACEIQVEVVDEEYEIHSVKVVDYYLKNGGLLLLEELWRKHFLSVMKPRFMPALWSIKHTEERLRVKLKEGRITNEDLKCVGLTTLPKQT